MTPRAVPRRILHASAHRGCSRAGAQCFDTQPERLGSLLPAWRARWSDEAAERCNGYPTLRPRPSQKPVFNTLFDLADAGHRQFGNEFDVFGASVARFG